MNSLTLIYLNRFLLVRNLALAIAIDFWFCWFATGFLSLAVIQGIELEQVIRRREKARMT